MNLGFTEFIVVLLKQIKIIYYLVRSGTWGSSYRVDVSVSALLVFHSESYRLGSHIFFPILSLLPNRICKTIHLTCWKSILTRYVCAEVWFLMVSISLSLRPPILLLSDAFPGLLWWGAFCGHIPVNLSSTEIKLMSTEPGSRKCWFCHFTA